MEKTLKGNWGFILWTGFWLTILGFILVMGFSTGWADTKCVGPFESPTCTYIRCMEGECK